MLEPYACLLGVTVTGVRQLAVVFDLVCTDRVTARARAERPLPLWACV